MARKRFTLSPSVIFFPLFAVLLVGTFIAVSQSQKDQNLTSNAATVNCTVSASQLTTTAAEQQLLTDINNYRAQNGLTKLTVDPTLKQASAWLDNDMVTHNTLSHTDSLGRSTPTRLTDCGYDISNNNAESISNESSNPATVFNDWKADPLHNEIMLLTWPNIVGISMQTSSAGVTFWAMDVGKNPSLGTTQPAPSLITPTLFCEGSSSCVPTVSPTAGVIKNPTQTVTTAAPSNSNHYFNSSFNWTNTNSLRNVGAISK